VNVITKKKIKKILDFFLGGVAGRLEGSDAGAIHMAVGGIPTGAISIPCRYTHSPVEMASVSDIENAVKLLVECIK
jgi:putative aminopeptidase FrvX